MRKFLAFVLALALASVSEQAKAIYVFNGSRGLDTFSATIEQLTLATAATDVFCIQGAANIFIKIQGVRISGVASANTIAKVSITKRSSLDTGTSSAVTIVPHDSGSPAAKASVVSYTANPTLGNTVGDIRGENLVFAGSSAPNLNISSTVFQFSVYDGQVPLLRTAAEEVCVNLNGQTISGGAITVDVQWTEDLIR